MKIKTDDAYIDSTNRKKLELDWENRIFNTRGYALRECEREGGGEKTEKTLAPAFSARTASPDNRGRRI